LTPSPFPAVLATLVESRSVPAKGILNRSQSSRCVGPQIGEPTAVEDPLVILRMATVGWSSRAPSRPVAGLGNGTVDGVISTNDLVSAIIPTSSTTLARHLLKDRAGACC